MNFERYEVEQLKKADGRTIGAGEVRKLCDDWLELQKRNRLLEEQETHWHNAFNRGKVKRDEIEEELVHCREKYAIALEWIDQLQWEIKNQKNL